MLVDSIWSLLGLGKKAPEQEHDLIELEVRMKPMEGQANHLQIALRAKLVSAQSDDDWKPWCERMITQLGAYLIAKRT